MDVKWDQCGIRVRPEIGAESWESGRQTNSALRSVYTGYHRVNSSLGSEATGGRVSTVGQGGQHPNTQS